MSHSFFQDAKDVKINGGFQIAAAPGGSVTINQGAQARALDTLSEVAAHAALHDSAARFPAPRCHRNTRTTYLDGLERWMLGLDGEYKSKRLIWLNGGAGAGKSAIMQSIVERCAKHAAILGAFFFSRTDTSRNYAEVLIPTLAYQLARAFPAAMAVLEPIILRDPLIFKASLERQADELLVQPLLYLVETGVIDITSPLRRVFVIDGLDECSDPQKQALIVHALSTVLQDNLVPVCFLIASRPEIAISRAFHRVHSILSSIALDDNDEASSDIRQFIEDSFFDILETHPLRAHIPMNWPHPYSVDELVWKSSGHFIFAATTMRFISSLDEHPARALQVLEGLVSSRTGSPFAELDALYMHILTSAKYHSEVLAILRHCVLTKMDNSVKAICFMYPHFSPEDVELFLSDVQALVSLSPNDAAEMCILLKHASLSDFLQDGHRSHTLYMCEEEYRAFFLPQYFQLLDNLISPQPLQLPFSIGLPYYAHGLMLELVDAVDYSQDIGSLQSLISGHSPRDIWDLSMKPWPGDPERNTSGPSNVMRSICDYTRAIRHSVANHDNTLYIHQFKIFIQILMDNLDRDVQAKPQHRIVPALMFSSGLATHLTALNHVAPALLEYFLSPQHNINRRYIQFFRHLTITGGHYWGELSPQSHEAFRTLPYPQMSWSSDLAYGLELVLQHLVGYSWIPEFIRPNLHRQWLNRVKRMKHVSQGSPKLSSKFDFRSYYDTRSRPSGRRRCTTTSATFRMYWQPDFLYAKLKRYGYSRDHVTKLHKRRRQCLVLLRAVIFYLHKCDCTSELARLARKSLPKAALWFPALMKRARAKMDAYVSRWEESRDGLLEKAQSLTINDMD